MRLKIYVVSRIYAPEPSAATFRLQALVSELAKDANLVKVFTSRPLEEYRRLEQEKLANVSVKRAPVVRDRRRQIRGYLSYISFDLPAFFRVLFSSKPDHIIVEPPPTTGFVIWLVSKLRGVTYSYYAADIWFDAAAQTGAPAWILSTLRRVELLVLRGATRVLSVNEGVTARLRELGHEDNVVTVGNGVDTTVFYPRSGQLAPGMPDSPYLLYSGTASEWQGADIFVEAFAEILADFPDLKLVFLGQGSAWDSLEDRGAKLPEGSILFLPLVPAAEAAIWASRAVACLASVDPKSGYHFALPTKVFASLACGTPLIFAGPTESPVNALMKNNLPSVYLGECVDYNIDELAFAMKRLLSLDLEATERQEIARWALANVSLQEVAARAKHEILSARNPR